MFMPLPLCAGSTAAVAAVAFHAGARPTSSSIRAVRIHPLCQSTAPVRRVQDSTRVPFHSRCHRHREPEPESDDDEPADYAASIDIPFVDAEDAQDEEVRKKHAAFCASMGLREAPDMFPTERDEISNYMIKITSSRANDQDVNNKVMALIVCAEAQKALDLASRVMDLIMDMASLDLNTSEFSQDTINQMVRTYAPIFLNVAKDAYNERIKIDSVVSFLDALRRLGAICHILVQDTVAMLKDVPLENHINSSMGTLSLKFEKRLNNLKGEFMASAQATGIKHTLVMDMLFDGMKRSQLYIVRLIQHRRAVLDYLFLAQAAASEYKAQRKNR